MHAKTSSWQGFPPQSKAAIGQPIELAFDSNETRCFRRRLRGESDHPAPPPSERWTKCAAHLRGHFAGVGHQAEPDSRERDVSGYRTHRGAAISLRGAGLVHYVSLGCSRHPMTDPTPGPRRSAARPACRSRAAPARSRAGHRDGAQPGDTGGDAGCRRCGAGPDALIDLGAPLWARPCARVPFTAVLLGRSDIPDLAAGAAARPGELSLGDSYHRDRGRLGAPQGRRGHAAGMAATTASTCWIRIARQLNRIDRPRQCALSASSVRPWRPNREISALATHRRGGRHGTLQAAGAPLSGRKL